MEVCSNEIELFWTRAYPRVSRARISSWLETLLLCQGLEGHQDWGVSQVPMPCCETVAWPVGHRAEGMVVLLPPRWPMLQGLVDVVQVCGAGVGEGE